MELIVICSYSSIYNKIEELRAIDADLDRFKTTPLEKESIPTPLSTYQKIISFFTAKAPLPPPAPPQKDFSTHLQDLILHLKEVVDQTVHSVRGETDQKIKYITFLQFQDLRMRVQKEVDEGVFRDLMQKHSADKPLLEEFKRSTSQMQAILYNALIRGNDRQEVWGTRFCPEEVFSTKNWESVMAMTQHLFLEKPGIFKYVFLYSFSLLLTQVASIVFAQNWWNKITTTGPHKVPIYLGALPLITPFKNDLENLKKENIGAVLTLVEPFENHSTGWISSPVTTTDWKNAKIKQLQIPIEDFNTGSIEQIELGVEFIRWNVLNDRSVYIHCKAGRGRSALVLMAYLIKYEQLSAKEAFKLVQSQRAHAGFSESSSKMKTLLEYERRVS